MGSQHILVGIYSTILKIKNINNYGVTLSGDAIIIYLHNFWVITI